MSRKTLCLQAGTVSFGLVPCLTPPPGANPLIWIIRWAKIGINQKRGDTKTVSRVAKLKIKIISMIF